MKCKILVLDYVESRDLRLKHLVWPADLSEDQTSADLVVTGRHNLLEFRHVNTNKITLDFEDGAYMDSEASGLLTIFDTMC